MHPQPWHTAWKRHHVALSLTRFQQHHVCPRESHRCPGNRPSAVDPCGLTAGRHGRPILVLEVRLSFPIHVSGQLLKLLFQEHCSVISSRLGIQMCRWSEGCGGLYDCPEPSGSFSPHHRETWSSPAPGSDQWLSDNLWPMNCEPKRLKAWTWFPKFYPPPATVISDIPGGEICLGLSAGVKWVRTPTSTYTHTDHRRMSTISKK